MGRHKNSVYAKTLAEVRAARPPGRPSRASSWQFYLTFGSSDGLGTLLHREIHAVISGAELAALVGAIPGSTMDDDEDLKAVIRVRNLLLGKEFSNG